MPTWLIPVTLTGCAGLFFWRTFVNLRKARTIEDVPTSKVRSAHQGYVELIGTTAHAGREALSAPLTGMDCIWYDYKIERYEGGKKNHWITVEQDRSEQHFKLTDETGECIIQPRGSEVITRSRKQWTGYDRHPRKTEHVSFLRALARQRYRYTEQRIQADQPLYAIGWFSTKHAPSLSEQENASRKQLLNSWKQDYPTLLGRFDQTGDGVIDIREWEQARVAAEQEAKQEVREKKPAPPVHYLTRPADGRPWLLSTEDPEDLSKKYRRQSLFHMLASLMASAGSFWFFIQQ